MEPREAVVATDTVMAIGMVITTVTVQATTMAPMEKTGDVNS